MSYQKRKKFSSFISNQVLLQQLKLYLCHNVKIFNLITPFGLLITFLDFLILFFYLNDKAPPDNSFSRIPNTSADISLICRNSVPINC